MKFCKTPKNAFSGFIIPRNIENCKMCDPVHGIKLEIYVISWPINLESVFF